MPLVMNGTTIPENVANSFSFNGVNITQVVYNGVAVWNQSLGLTVGWSGSSWVYSMTTSSLYGLEMSGFNFRATTVYGTGGWITVDSNGTFSGTTRSIRSNGSTYTWVLSSGNTLNLSGGSGFVTYAPSTKSFSGNSAWSDQGLLTSGGLFCWKYTASPSQQGFYVSLT